MENRWSYPHFFKWVSCCQAKGSRLDSTFSSQSAKFDGRARRTQLIGSKQGGYSSTTVRLTGYKSLIDHCLLRLALLPTLLIIIYVWLDTMVERSLFWLKGTTDRLLGQQQDKRIAFSISLYLSLVFLLIYLDLKRKKGKIDRRRKKFKNGRRTMSNQFLTDFSIKFNLGFSLFNASLFLTCQIGS